MTSIYLDINYRDLYLYPFVLGPSSVRGNPVSYHWGKQTFQFTWTKEFPGMQDLKSSWTKIQTNWNKVS